MEVTEFSEKDRLKWEVTRKKSKGRIVVIPALISAITYGILMYLSGVVIKRFHSTYSDLLGKSLVFGFNMFTFHLAVWRTNELKFLGEIPNKWKSNNKSYDK